MNKHNLILMNNIDGKTPLEFAIFKNNTKTIG